MGSVVIRRESCLNFRFAKMTCFRCGEICRENSISEDLTIDTGRCNDCGLCLAACPAEAVASDMVTPAGIEMLFSEEQHVILECNRQNKESRWPCLGFLDARILMSLVFCASSSDRQVVVNTDGCESCRFLVAKELLKLTAEVNTCLALLGKRPLIIGEQVASMERPVRVVSRRDFFSLLLGDAVSTVREIVREPAEAGEQLPRRQWFLRYSEEFDNGHISGALFYSLTISSGCRTCGLCYKLCPNKAITVFDHGQAMEFFHNPALCTGCEVCIRHCPCQAISLKPAERFGFQSVGKQEMPKCEMCGCVYQPQANQPVCMECFLKSR